MKLHEILLNEELITYHKLLADSVISELEKIFTYPPPSGDRDINILPSPNPWPQCDPTKSKDYYYVYLTANGLSYAYIAFQLAHEITHIYCDARRTNRFIECVCEMVSLKCLYKLS